MSEDLFMVVTEDGARVVDGAGKGMTQQAADSAVTEKNRQAEALGVKARYKVAPFVK